MQVKKDIFLWLDEFILFNIISCLHFGLSLGNTWKSESVAIISLDAALTLQSASQTTVNNLTAKLKYVDTVMKGDNLLSDNLTLNYSLCQIIYAQQKLVGIENISLNGMSSVVYWKKNQLKKIKELKNK